MPYFQDYNREEEDQNQNPSVQISGASATTSPNGQASQPSNNQLNTGSHYQNLDKYLSQNNPSQFAQQFTGKVSDEINQAKQNQDSTANQFRNQVNSQNQTPTSEQINSAIANPGQANPQDFQKWLNQAYSGPRSLPENQSLYNQFWSGTNKAQTDANLLGSQGGRYTLLDSYYGSPTYSQGQKKLDNLMIEQGGLGDLRGLQNQAAGLVGQGNNLTNQLQNEASQKAGQVEQSARAARNAIGIDQNGQVITDPNAQGYGALGAQQKLANDQLAQLNQQRKDQFDNLYQGFKNHSLTPDQLAELGLENYTLYGDLDPQNYLSANAPLNLDQALDEPQRNYIRALDQLAGISDPFAQGQAQSRPDAYTFQKDRLLNDIHKGADAYQNEFRNIVNSIQGNGMLRGIDTGQNPVEIFNSLKKERDDLQTIVDNTGDTRSRAKLPQMNETLNALSGLMAKYGIDPQTGNLKTLGSAVPRDRPITARVR